MKLMRIVDDTVVEIVEVPDLVSVLDTPATDDAPAIYSERPALISDFFTDDVGIIPHVGQCDVGWIRVGEKWKAPPPFVPPVSVRVASAKQLRYALNASGQRAAWDAAVSASSADTKDYWAAEPNPPESGPKMRRIATAAGVNLTALYDLALTL